MTQPYAVIARDNLMRAEGGVIERLATLKWMRTMLSALQAVKKLPGTFEPPDPEMLLQTLINNIDAGDHQP